VTARGSVTVLAMICIDIPGIAPLRLQHLVPDFNGTLAATVRAVLLRAWRGVAARSARIRTESGHRPAPGTAPPCRSGARPAPGHGRSWSAGRPAERSAAPAR